MQNSRATTKHMRSERMRKQRGPKRKERERESNSGSARILCNHFKDTCIECTIRMHKFHLPQFIQIKFKKTRKQKVPSVEKCKKKIQRGEALLA